jgi:hypothetical protein
MALQEEELILLICSDMYGAVKFTSGACAARRGREGALVAAVRNETVSRFRRTYRRALVTARVVMEVWRS